jgi:hypothetical protein
MKIIRTLLLPVVFVLAAAGCEAKKEPGKVTITVDTAKMEQESKEALQKAGEGIEKVGKELQEKAQESD